MTTTMPAEAPASPRDRKTPAVKRAPRKAPTAALALVEPPGKPASVGRMAAFIKEMNVTPVNANRGPQDLHISETRLGDAYDAISEFSAATEAQRFIITVWGASTHVFRRFPAHARLSCLAEGPGSGKTVNLELACSISSKPEIFGYSSQAAVHVYLDENPDSTLGVDECDRIWGTTGRARSKNGIMLAVINAGYASAGKVLVVRGGKAVKIPVYSPLACAGLGSLPIDTRTRAIPIMLEMGTPRNAWLPERYGDHMTMLGNGLNDWLNTQAAVNHLLSSPSMVSDLEGTPRWQLIMAPLAAIASYAGCYEQFKDAVQEIVTDIKMNPPLTTSALMVADLREVWPTKTTLMSAMDIAAVLHDHESGRWAKFSTTSPAELEKLVAWHMANAGKPGIRSTVTGPANAKRRGYLRRDVFGTVLE